MDYDELVAHLAIAIVSELNRRKVSADYDSVCSWLRGRVIHISDDPSELASEYCGK